MAARAISQISSNERISACGSHRTPSSGMQYRQRKLHRSVMLMRNTRTAEIERGPVSKPAGAADVSITGKRIGHILRGNRVQGEYKSSWEFLWGDTLGESSETRQRLPVPSPLYSGERARVRGFRGAQGCAIFQTPQK